MVSERSRARVPVKVCALVNQSNAASITFQNIPKFPVEIRAAKRIATAADRQGVLVYVGGRNES